MLAPVFLDAKQNIVWPAGKIPVDAIHNLRLYFFAGVVKVVPIITWDFNYDVIHVNRYIIGQATLLLYNIHYFLLNIFHNGIRVYLRLVFKLTDALQICSKKYDF